MPLSAVDEVDRVNYMLSMVLSCSELYTSPQERGVGVAPKRFVGFNRNGWSESTDLLLAKSSGVRMSLLPPHTISPSDIIDNSFRFTPQT